MKILICGAGIAGLALAQRMHSHGWEVCLVEHAPGPRDQGYMLDFIGPGYDAAEAMGVLPGLQQLGYGLEEVAYIDRRGRRRARLDYRRFARLLNGRLLSIMRPDLEAALRDEVINVVDLRYARGIVSVDNSPTGVCATLTDGTRVDADLLVGADGVHWAVRRLAFGAEEHFFRYLGFHAAAYIFDDPEIRAQLHDRFYLTDSINRLMGLYGLRDGRVATFCVHRAPDSTLPRDPRATLRQIYTSLGWVVPRALEQCPPASDLYYDQVAQVVVPHWTSQRVTLVGDACQAVSLLAGQGASLAVAGAYVLGEQLATADSIDAALERYEQVWRPVVEEKQRIGRRGAEWFLPKTPAELWGRRIMLAAGSLPVLDTFVGRELLGKSNLRIRDIARFTPARSNRMALLSQPQTPVASRSDACAMFARSRSPMLRAFFGAPRWLYRLGLGRLLGHRFMLLTHRGRTSGRTYQTALEVVKYDPDWQESVVCFGWGTRADWYRNVIAAPPVAFESAGHRFAKPDFRVLASDENYAIVAEYVHRLPPIARPLASLLGLDVRGSEDKRRAHSQHLLMVALRPATPRVSSTTIASQAEPVPTSMR